VRLDDVDLERPDPLTEIDADEDVWVIESAPPSTLRRKCAGTLSAARPKARLAFWVHTMRNDSVGPLRVELSRAGQVPAPLGVIETGGMSAAKQPLGLERGCSRPSRQRMVKRVLRLYASGLGSAPNDCRSNCRALPALVQRDVAVLR
jgi:hypothetical protein